MSTSAPTHVVEVNGDAIERYVVTAQDVGLAATTTDAVTGGTPEANAQTTRAILEGHAGPRRGLALLNAGAAIYAGGRSDSLREGVEAAREAVDSGAALRTPRPMTSRDRYDIASSAIVNVDSLVCDERASSASSTPPARTWPGGAARCRSPSSSARRRARGDDRPFSEALTRPGVSLIAEHKRRSPSAGEIRAGARRSPRSSAPTSAAAPPRSRSSPRSATSAARSTTCARRARSVGAADPAQGLHRRSLPGLRVRGRGRRRDPAHRRGARRGRPDAAAPRGARPGPRRAGRGPRRGGARPRAGGRRRRRHRHQQPRPQRLLGRHRAHLRAAQRRAAGKTVVSESGFHRREQLDDLERVGVDAVLIGGG